MNIAQGISVLAAICSVSVRAASPEVITPPEEFFMKVRERDREVAREFYKKYVDIDGLPVLAGESVADEALHRTHEIVKNMLAGRPDILEAMERNGMYLIIIGRDQFYTDMPEYRNHPNPEYQNERVRGTGGKPTSFGEENLLSLPIDRYDDESIAVHEFCHTIDSTLRSIDPGWTERRNTAFKRAMDKGLWKNAYASSNPGEFWAEVAQSYFDANRVNNWNHGPIGTREQLKAYDPETYELVRSTFNLSPEQDWRYSYAAKVPNITAPPEGFSIDRHYKKFTYAREFPVVGRDASDEALLAANDVIRKMFAYRHDILKALINGGFKLVVLGKEEKISDLPEIKNIAGAGEIDVLARYLDFSPAVNLMVAAEENVLGDHRQPMAGGSQVIRAFARALYEVTARRPVDPNWENRGREVQQYELRVQRLDTRFGETVRDAWHDAMANGLWKGTSAIHDETRYWVEGVLAYFDAAGQSAAPLDAPQPVVTREALREYDPVLYEIVHETFAYSGRPEWRLPKR